MRRAESPAAAGHAETLLWGGVVGFALGGFFDGILLHQILQWHHLLSLVPGMADLRLQVLWDGYFHALMYLVGLVGLWGLWRSHGAVQRGRRAPLLPSLLAGFGLWHVVDGLLSHWILGIHRVRLEDPLLWDLVWFFAFGILPLLAAWHLRGKADKRLRGSFTALSLVTAGTIGAGTWALQRPPGQAFTAIVFEADARPEEVLRVLAAADANIVWSDSSMTVLLLEATPLKALALYAQGAVFVGSAGIPGGCLSWKAGLERLPKFPDRAKL